MDPKLHDDRLRIGASWYPEMWPHQEWPKDVARMKELGFNVVRLFEFAWHRFEPAEGRYDFDWALAVMDLCYRAGIDVLVGTPTAAPPAWLTAKYPEVLQVGPDGRRATHGRRKHYSHLSRRYRALAAGIVGKMVEAFADHPALHSWQIDNEMSGRDYSDESRDLFHAYLEARFGTVEAMNRAWGLEFWSQAYASFDEVPMPTASVGSIEVPERHHPSLILALADFFSRGWTRFISEQCDVIRARSDRPITTNMCGSSTGSDWFAHNRALDRVGYSLYKDVPHYPWNLMFLDRMRAEKPGRPYWLLETAPNWSGGGKQWNIHHHGAGLRAMTWLATALGGSMTLYWQWRSHWAGQEMQHGTCVSATGQWRPNKETWTRLASDFAEHGDWLLAHPPPPAEVALVHSTRAAWAFSIDPIDEDMAYVTRWRDDYHLPLARGHVWRDVIGDEADFERYKILLLPMMPVLPEAMRARLPAWVEAGGRLLLGPRTGYRTEAFTAFTDRTFGGLEDLMGAESALGFTAHGREDRVRIEFAGGPTSRTRAWCEAFAPTRAEPLAHYRGEGEYGDGQVAAVRHRIGQGTVLTLGAMIEPAVYVGLVRELMDEVDARPVAEGAADVVVVPRAAEGGEVAGWAVVNLAEGPRAVTLPAGGTDLLRNVPSDRELSLEPLGVRVVVKR